VPPGPPILCPVCHAPTERAAAGCDACGLLFASRIPPAVHALDGYQPLRPLGGGGMSSIYLALDPTGELCVIKTLASVDGQPDPQWRADATRCLHQEALLLRQLDHPNIAQVRDWLSTPGGDFLILEYVPGPTLEQSLTRPDGRGGTLPGAPLPLAEVLAHGVSVAGVLEYLAALPQPLVHHDIKPANLIVRPDDGRLVLVDFGSALLPDADDGTARLDSYGTPGYAAPEQYRGQSSAQSDVYGLAATLYHLLTDDDPGAHPLRFPALATLPADVADALRPALAPDPAARPTAARLRVALAELATTTRPLAS
jgi:serine/threonine-protein kinase